MGVTYRGRHSDDFGLAVKTDPHILPGFENKTKSIPGMDGEYYVNTSYGVRIIPLEIGFVAHDLTDYETRLERLSSWLRPDRGEGEFISDNDPDKTYYAVLDSQDISRVEDIARMGKGSLELMCPDPFGYGEEQTYSISDNLSVANEGTYETNPVFDLEATQDVTLLSVENKDNLREDGSERSVTLGTESEADEKTVDTKKLVLHDTMQSTSGWTKASDVDSGDISGSMVTDDDGFYAKEWGDEDSSADNDYGRSRNESLGDWIGPSLKRELDNPVEDSFTVEVSVENQNDENPDGSSIGPDHTGMIEVYFRDVNDNMIAKIQFGDTYGNKIENKAAFEKGREDSIGKKRWDFQRRGWNDFEGKLHVKRDTDDFIVYASKLENGEYVKEKRLRHRPIAESGTLDTHPLKSIQVAIRKWNGGRRIYNRIKELKVYDSIGEFDDLLDDDVTPIEIKKGDKIKIDGENSRVLLNGENAPRLRNLDSEFFTLVEGINDLKVSGPVKGTVSFRNRYL